MTHRNCFWARYELGRYVANDTYDSDRRCRLWEGEGRGCCVVAIEGRLSKVDKNVQGEKVTSAE